MAGIIKDLIVVGPGELGYRVATFWKRAHPEAKVHLKTRSDKKERSECWRSAGFLPASTYDDVSPSPYVVFSAPPTGNDEYPRDVLDAVNVWHRKDSGSGCFVFTSSGGVYAENAGGTVSEDSEVKTDAQDVKRKPGIVDAEKPVLDNGGCVMRFGGLYTSYRGAHNYWLAKDAVPTSPDGLINLVHYEDAARAVIRALEMDLGPALLLVADGVPVSRREICQATLAHPKFAGGKVPEFGGSGIDGKKYDTAKVRETLKWTPKYTSFRSFMSEQHAEEEPFELPK